MNATEAPVEHIFTCPSCGECLEVNTSMRDVLLKYGCVICGREITRAAFSLA